MVTAPRGLGLADLLKQQAPAIVSEFYAFFDGISERVGEELFDCFLHFWHAFWRFIEEWAGGTIEYNSERAPALCAPEWAIQAGGLLARGKNKEEQTPY